jgi:uncharacterized protein YbaR (Trm112 family)
MIPSLLARYYKTRYRAKRFFRAFRVSMNWSVLDIGSGDSPFPPADVICEKFPWDDSERVTGFIHDRPLVIGDAEALPFRDQSFDFINCCHVLEHVCHPDLAIRELMRVGKRGYIEMPSSYFEKVFRSYPGHLWFVHNEKGTIVFKPKPQGTLDSEINDLYDNHLLDIDSLFSIYYYGRMSTLGVVSFFWEKQINYRLDGQIQSPEKAQELFEKASSVVSPQKQKQIRRLSLPALAKKVIRWWFLRGKKIDLAQILACPTCKGKLFRKEGTYECASCRLSYPIQAEIPILLKETASPLR